MLVLVIATMSLGVGGLTCIPVRSCRCKGKNSLSVKRFIEGSTRRKADTPEYTSGFV